MQASDHNNSGHYENAKQCGNMSLCCNICAITKYVLLLLAGIALVVVYFTIGFSWLYAATGTAEDIINTHCYQTCYYDYYGVYRCTQVCTDY